VHTYKIIEYNNGIISTVRRVDFVSDRMLYVILKGRKYIVFEVFIPQ
jgi:hypothetical protein